MSYLSELRIVEAIELLTVTNNSAIQCTAISNQPASQLHRFVCREQRLLRKIGASKGHRFATLQCMRIELEMAISTKAVAASNTAASCYKYQPEKADYYQGDEE